MGCLTFLQNSLLYGMSYFLTKQVIVIIALCANLQLGYIESHMVHFNGEYTITLDLQEVTDVQVR